MADSKEFEAALMAKLAHGQFDKTFLKTTSTAIMELRKQGLVIDDIFIKGKPRFDRIIINGKPDPEFFGKMKDILVRPKFSRFEVFPYGILNPEALKVQVTFGL